MRAGLVGVAVLVWLVLAEVAAAAPTVTGSLDPPTIAAGGTSTLTLTLSEPAPEGGTPLEIVWAEGPPWYGEPAKRQNVTVPAGSQTASVQSPVFPTSLIKAYKYVPRVFVPGVSMSVPVATLTVLGADPAGWDLLSWEGPLAVISGARVTTTLTINRPAPAGGLLIELISAGASGPTLGAGRVAYFPAGAARVALDSGGTGSDVSTAVLKATAHTGTRDRGPGDSGILFGSRAGWLAAVVPADVFSLGSRFTYRTTFELVQAVGIGKVSSPFATTVSLVSDTPGVTVPATVDVPAGSAGGVYTLTVSPTVRASMARIRASWNGQTTTNTIFIQGTPPDPDATPTPTPSPTPAATPVPGDTVEPETHVHERPAGNVPRGPVKFELYTSQRGSTFECRLDGPDGAIGSYGTCQSPQVYTGLADGVYTFFVRSVDPSGNRDSTPDRVAFDVGPVGATSSSPMYPPPAPRIVEPSGADKIRTSTVSFWGYGSPGDQLHIYDGGTLRATTTLNDHGQWFLDVPGVADGTHRFTVRAGNAAGLSAPSAERVIEVFTRAPQPPVITSPPNMSHAPARTFTLKGTAQPDTTIELFEDGRSIAKFPSGDGNWAHTFTARGYGLRSYRATATDAEGNTSALSALHRVRV